GPELPFDLMAHGLDLGEPGDVGHDRHRRAARALDAGPHRGQRRRIPAVNRYLCALLRKEPSDRGANAARTPVTNATLSLRALMFRSALSRRALFNRTGSS